MFRYCEGDLSGYPCRKPPGEFLQQAFGAPEVQRAFRSVGGYKHVEANANAVGHLLPDPRLKLKEYLLVSSNMAEKSTHLQFHDFLITSIYIVISFAMFDCQYLFDILSALVCFTHLGSGVLQFCEGAWVYSLFVFQSFCQTSIWDHHRSSHIITVMCVGWKHLWEFSLIVFHPCSKWFISFLN